MLASAMLLATFLFVSCDAPPASPAESGDLAGAAAQRTARAEKADSLAEYLIARTDSLLRSIDPLSSGEQQLLRRFAQNDHLAAARRLGSERVPDRRGAGELMSRPADASSLVQLRTNDSYVIDPRMGYAVPLVVPAAAHLTERIGQRFQQDLLALGLPPYRFILTNLMRTGIDQAHLRGTNVNAARGESAHEYGTTFDVYYGRFHYAAARDSIALSASRQADLDEAHFRQRLRRAYRQLGRTRDESIKAVLGRTLLHLQEQGLLLAMYERRQPVFHVTVAREVEPPRRDPDTEEETAAVRRFFANAESQLSDVDDDIEDLEEASGDAQRSLARLKEMRDTLWHELDRIEGVSPVETREARSDLQRKLAALEGEVERTRLTFAEGGRTVHRRLHTRLQRWDRALTQLETRVENAPRNTSVRYGEHVSDLRARHGELQRVLQALEGTSGEEFETLRAEAADALAHLVADLQVVSAEVDEAAQ